MSLRIKTIARLTGVREATLRAWERRYGFPTPARASNGYRTYSREDAEAIRRVARLLEQGYTASEAISAVRETPTDSLPLRQRIEERFWSAVMMLDEGSAQAALNEAASVMDALTCCDELLLPLLRRISERLDVAREHLASAVIRHRLRLFVNAVTERTTGPGVVLACPPEDQHEGGLLGLALHLRTNGFRVMLLGANTPIEALRAACEHGRAGLVGLSFVRQFQATEFEGLLRRVVASVPVPVVVGGPSAKEHLQAVFAAGAFFADSPSEFSNLWQRMSGQPRGRA